MNSLRVMLVASACALAACATTPESTPAAAPVAQAPKIANVGGNWNVLVQTPIGPVHGSMTNVQDGAAFSGKMLSDRGNVEYTGTVEGKQVKFAYMTSVGIRFEYSGVVDGDSMTGTAIFGPNGDGTWTATRKSP